MKELEVPSYMENYNMWGNIPDINAHGGGGSYDHNHGGGGAFLDQQKPSFLYRSPSSTSLYNMANAAHQSSFML